MTLIKTFISYIVYLPFTLFFICNILLANPSQTEKEIIVITDQGKDFKIPSKIYDLISNPELSSFKRQLGSILFAPVTVLLKEKNKGVLTHPEIEFRFPKGGGEIDLSRFVANKRGTFYVFFHFDEDVSEKEYYNLLFVSNSKKRKIDDVIYGSGCNTILDLTKYYLSKGISYGFAVNTTDQRHVSTLGGHFVFSYYKNRHYAMTQISFTDKKKLQLLCEE